MSAINPQLENNVAAKNESNLNTNNNSSSIFPTCCGIFCRTSKKQSATVRTTNAWSNTKEETKIEEEKEAKAMNVIEKVMSSSSSTNNSPKEENVITSEPKKQQNGEINKIKENDTNITTNEEELIFRKEDDWTEEEISRWCPNDYEKNLVKLTWSDDFDFLYELGTDIYTYIFDHTPQAKLLFVKIHRHGDKWKESADFRTQALKFVQTISYAAKNIYHMEECLQNRLYEIGEIHVKYASRGFKIEYWNIFLDAMENALTKHIASTPKLTAQERADATRVWRQLAHYIIVHMKRGYLAKEAQNKK
ncbi:GLOBIN domain-containing protein [Meloidogyne graminicola]|uniref:GLOBIN domain-containing protein n=1 Tax=Meloidogyne graminicola TaxID=189291 RepID=A0A8S9ZL66_9BILA|nr:GLOBIN domain-containing protein [Meloidogyne graminicola]